MIPRKNIEKINKNTYPIQGTLPAWRMDHKNYETWTVYFALQTFILNDFINFITNKENTKIYGQMGIC